MIKIIIALMFFNDCEKPVQQRMVRDIEKFYSCKAYIMNPEPLPSTAYYAPRGRYRADKLLEFLEKNKPGNAKLVGFTGKDISTTAHGVYDWGVFGLGSPSKGVSVMSTKRLKKGTQEEINNKILNTTLHEIGHSFGLEHCPDRRCLMRDAEGRLWPEDSKPPLMCGKCLGKIHKG